MTRADELLHGALLHADGGIVLNRGRAHPGLRMPSSVRSKAGYAQNAI
jgi:hypothetical protein